jgi:hypothetical protein
LDLQALDFQMLRLNSTIALFEEPGSQPSNGPGGGFNIAGGSMLFGAGVWTLLAKRSA